MRMWRAQDRQGAVASVNMALERLHGTWKGKYFRHSQNKRLDEALALLLEAIEHYNKVHEIRVITNSLNAGNNLFKGCSWNDRWPTPAGGIASTPSKCSRLLQRSNRGGWSGSVDLADGEQQLCSAFDEAGHGAIHGDQVQGVRVQARGTALS
jgi:hypothetical protein